MEHQGAREIDLKPISLDEHTSAHLCVYCAPLSTKLHKHLVSTLGRLGPGFLSTLLQTCFIFVHSDEHNKNILSYEH